MSITLKDVTDFTQKLNDIVNERTTYMFDLVRDVDAYSKPSGQLAGNQMFLDIQNNDKQIISMLKKSQQSLHDYIIAKSQMKLVPKYWKRAYANNTLTGRKRLSYEQRLADANDVLIKKANLGF